MRWVVVAAALLYPMETQGQIAPDGNDPSTGAWNITYQIPAGWRVAQVAGPARILGSSESGEAIFVAPGLYQSAEEAEADLSVFYSTLELEAYPVEPPPAPPSPDCRPRSRRTPAKTRAAKPCRVDTSSCSRRTAPASSCWA